MQTKTIATFLTVGSVILLAGAGTASASGSSSPIASCPNPSGTPAMYEAYVYKGTTYGGQCYVLRLDPNALVTNWWAGYDASEGLPNDQIQSVKTGSGVRIKMFWNSFNTQDHGGILTFGPNARVTSLGGWNNNVSAVRLQSYAKMPADCNVSNVSHKLSIYDGPGYAGRSTDCTMLGDTISYPNPVQMAFRNDTMSSFFRGATTHVFWLYDDINYNKQMADTSKDCSDMSNLAACGVFYYSSNGDNKVSSVYCDPYR